MTVESCTNLSSLTNANIGTINYTLNQLTLIAIPVTQNPDCGVPLSCVLTDGQTSVPSFITIEPGNKLKLLSNDATNLGPSINVNCSYQSLSISVPLTFSAQPPDCGINFSVDPNTLTVAQGSTGTSQLSLSFGP